MSVTDLPKSLPTDPNARPPDEDKVVYREVEKSLLNKDCRPNTFHLKNKGITILAKGVEQLPPQHGRPASEEEAKKLKERFEVTFEPVVHGIVDGGHTYEIIQNNLERIEEENRLGNGEKVIDQFVKVEVLVGVEDEMATEIAQGLNTAVQVKAHSLANLARKFDWIKDVLRGEAYANEIAYRENEDKYYNVMDLIAMMDLFNIEGYPVEEQKHPIRSCASANALMRDYYGDRSKFERFRPVLKEIFLLRDIIESSAYEIYKKGKGTAKVKWLGPGKRSRFVFLSASGVEKTVEWVPFKGALFPMISAFRCYVELDPARDHYRWKVPFEKIVEAWERLAPKLLVATQETSEDVGRKPDSIAKAKWHWTNLCHTVYFEMQQTR